METRSCLRALEELRLADCDRVGGKAAALGELLQRGYRVPPGFCITLDAYREFIATAGAAELEARAGEDPAALAELGHRLAAAPAPDTALATIACGLERLKPRTALAVRSSATGEDSADASFAGQYDSFLGVVPHSVADGVRRCWLSYWAERAVAYRRDRGEAAAGGMAVIVQEMVQADSAGVVFTLDPVNGDPFVILTEAVAGLADGLVGGARRGQQYIVDAITLEVREAPQNPVLNRAAVTDIAATALRVEEDLGRGQDIEWAIEDRGLWLLQARPITGAPAFFPPVGAVPSSGTFSLADPTPEVPLLGGLREREPEVLARAYARVGRCPPRIRQWTVHGYLYHQWDWPAPTRAGRLVESVRSMLAILRQADRTFTDWREQAVPAFRAALAEPDGAPRDVREAARLLGRRLDALAEWFPRMHHVGLISETLAERLAALYGRFVAGSYRFTDLLAGLPSATVERDAALWRLAEAARCDPDVTSILTSGPADSLLQRLEAHGPRRWVELLNQFLREYGHVGPASSDLLKPTWREDPRPLLQLVLQHMTAPEAMAARQKARQSLAQRREEATADACAQVGRGVAERILGLKGWLFRRIITHAQRFYPIREERDDLYYRGIAALRASALRLGGLLCAEGAVDAPMDAFFLMPSEVGRLAETADAELVREVGRRATVRRRRYRCQSLLSPPRTFPQAGPEAPVVAHTAAAPQLSGTAASAGVATGPARVVLEASGLQAVGPGDVLVCPATKPDWTPVFGIIAALVADRGGVLSHGGNLAREYGLPAVVGVGDATGRISDGDMLTVDGAAGAVFVHTQHGG